MLQNNNSHKLFHDNREAFKYDICHGVTSVPLLLILANELHTHQSYFQTNPKVLNSKKANFTIKVHQVHLSPHKPYSQHEGTYYHQGFVSTVTPHNIIFAKR